MILVGDGGRALVRRNGELVIRMKRTFGKETSTK